VKAAITVVLGLSLMAAGCTTTGGGREVNEKKAAQVNAELAVGYLGQGELQLAKSKAEKALGYDSNNALANNVNGSIQQRLRNMTAADKYFRRAVELEPDKPDYANSYGVYLCEAGRIGEGVQQFVSVANNPLHRAPALAFENAATCATKGGMLSEAEVYLNEALRIQPSLESARSSLLELQFKAKRYSAVLATVERLERSGQSTPKSLRMGYDSAKQLRKPGHVSRSRELLRSRFADSYQARSLND